jgi:virginiamycin B lyase
LEPLEDRCLLSTGLSEFNVTASAITAGPDGNLWFADGPAIGRITPSGVVTKYPAPAPAHLTAGPDGNIWFTMNQGNRIGRITPSGAVTLFPLVDLNAPGITAGPDGKVWFTVNGLDTGGRSKIGSITTDGTILEYVIDSNPEEITTGPDGNLWYTSTDFNSNFGKVGRISPEGVPLGEFTLSGLPFSITTGPDGNVWVTEADAVPYMGFLPIAPTDTGVARITTTGVVTEFHPIAGINWAMDSITAGPDGNLWFTEAPRLDHPAKIGSIRPDGSLVAELTLPDVITLNGYVRFKTGIQIVFGGFDITVGPHGDLWFTQALAGKIGVLHNYVETLYENVLGRPASQAEQNYWFNVQSQSGQAAVASGVQRSDEAHARLVAGWYQSYLGRPADAAGLQYYVALLRSGTEEQALAQLLASQEYYNHAPSVPGVGGGAPTDQTYVQALFQQLLGRGAGPDALAYWQAQVAAGGRAAAALQLMGSDEYHTAVVLDAYRMLLHRPLPPSQAEVNDWLSVDLNPVGPGLPWGVEGGRILFPVATPFDRESLLVALEQSEEFALDG